MTFPRATPEPPAGSGSADWDGEESEIEEISRRIDPDEAVKARIQKNEGSLVMHTNRRKVVFSSAAHHENEARARLFRQFGRRIRKRRDSLAERSNFELTVPFRYTDGRAAGAI